MVLANRRVIAKRSLEMTIGVGTQAPVVIKFARRGLCGGAIERVATALTNQHPLQQSWFNRAPRRVAFVLLQLLLGQGKSFLADQSRNRDLDPIFSGSFVVGTVAARQSLAFPQCSRDALPWVVLGLPIARPASIGRVAQQAPDRGPLPACRARPGRNLLLVQQTCNRPDVPSLLRIELVHPAHYRRL